MQMSVGFGPACRTVAVFAAASFTRHCQLCFGQFACRHSDTQFRVVAVGTDGLSRLIIEGCVVAPLCAL